MTARLACIPFNWRSHFASVQGSASRSVVHGYCKARSGLHTHTCVARYSRYDARSIPRGPHSPTCTRVAHTSQCMYASRAFVPRTGNGFLSVHDPLPGWSCRRGSKISNLTRASRRGGPPTRAPPDYCRGSKPGTIFPVSATVLEPQGGDLTQPRPTAWVSGTPTDTRALKGRDNRFQSHTYRSSKAIPCACKSFRNSS